MSAEIERKRNFTNYNCIFSCSGFGNALSFKDVNDDDISNIQNYVRTNSSHIIATNHTLKKADIFGALYANHPEQFQFSPGDAILIKQLANQVKKAVDGNGPNSGLNHFSIDRYNVEPKIIKRFSLDEQENQNESQTHYLLRKLLSAADRNIKRDKGGYRYDSDVKLYAAFLRMLVGPMAYETLQKNLECSLPSLSSTNRYISSSGCHITEGILRCEELAIYLSERSLDPVVCISEDATRITNRVQYDSKSNQLIGFVLPLKNGNGMPIPFQFPARHADEILSHFSHDHPVSSYINVIMAQPINTNVPPFCLMLFGSDNKYTSMHVANRWKCVEENLAKVKIQVLTFSSDSDAKFNSAMRQLSQLGHKTEIEWYSCRNSDGPFSFQDLIHILTKLRNFLLRTSYDKRTIPFGNYFIRIEHLYELLELFPKDQHQLTHSTLNPTDRQNYRSVLRLCDQRVTDLLRGHVKGSEATVQFLQIMRDINDCFTDVNLTPLQRVRKIWYSLFLIRIWRESILSSKTYRLKDNFLSSNCYSCLELNAHELINCLLYLKKVNKPEWFKPYLFSNQPCENIFRQLRSLSTVYSTVTNCTVKEATSRVANIQFQNQIMHTTSNQFVYPRMKKVSTCEKNIILPSASEIFKEVQFCQSLAIVTATKLGLIKKNNKHQTYACNIKPYVPKVMKKSKSANDDDVEPDPIQLEAIDFKNIKLKNYEGKIKPNDVNETGPYVVVTCEDDKQIVLKKTSLCWLLSTECKKLSSDRLYRVMTSIKESKSKSKSSLRKKTRKRLLGYRRKHIVK